MTVTWKQIREEPYRLLFPLGLGCAAMGMGVWIPFYFWPSAFPHPGQGHAVAQIQGFLLCFIFGFLTTMLPKVLGIKPLGAVQFAIFPVGLVGILVAAMANALLTAQALHLLLLLNFIVFIAIRLPERKANPPAAFLFIAFGMLADIAGTIVKILALCGILDARALRSASLLQYQAFPLLLILGVGGFLLPKLFANGTVNPRDLRGTAGAGIAGPLILSLVFLSSYALELFDIFPAHVDARSRLAHAMRACAWMWFLLPGIRAHKVSWKLPPYLQGARLSLFFMAAGLILPVFYPEYPLAWEHIVFISGFLLLTLSVASRVVAAHGARLDILLLHRKKAVGYGALIVVAMLTRVATDIWTNGHWLHMALASGFALIALAIWARIYFPLLLSFPKR